MNIFDSLVVILDIIFALPGTENNLPSMSILRGLRMLRIVRVIRNLVAFRELYLMMQGLVSAVRAIIFGTLLIVAVLILWSVLAVELVQEENLKLFNDGAYGDCVRCEVAFATVGHSMMTFISTIIAGDSWGTLALPLIERRPWTALIIIPALLSLELGLLNVVAAVIVDRQAQARQDDEKFLHQMREEELKKSYGRLQALFTSMDDDGSGSLTLEELIESYRTHSEFKELMELMDITEDDLPIVFQILDKDGSGDVNYGEFVEQLNTLKTTNSHTLLVLIKHLALRISEQADSAESGLHKLMEGLGLTASKTTRYMSRSSSEDVWYEDEPEVFVMPGTRLPTGILPEADSSVPQDAGNRESPSQQEFVGDSKDEVTSPRTFLDGRRASDISCKSSWSLRAATAACDVKHPSGHGFATSSAAAAAADLNVRFLDLSRHIQTSLAAITEDAVRQAGDKALMESTMALAKLEASLPLLFCPSPSSQPSHAGRQTAARFRVVASQPGLRGASCPRLHPLEAQAELPIREELE